MSDFTGSSKLRNNFLGLTDEEIKLYYFKAEKEIVGNEIGHLVHIRRSVADLTNSNFLAECCVDVVNEYLLAKNFRKESIC